MSGPEKPGLEPRSVLVALGGLGLAASALLEYTHYQAYRAPGASSYCTAGEKLDCTSVALSQFSVLLGVPMPLWGIAGFSALIIAAWFRSRWLVPLAAFAALASVALFGISIFVIGSVCLVCEVTHLAALALAVLSYRWRSSLTGDYRDKEHLTRIFALPAGIALSFAVFVKPYWQVFNWRSPFAMPQGVTEEGYPWLGAKEPELTLHEFVDYRCPHCARASNYTLGMVAKHSRSLRVVRRQHPGTRCRHQHELICLMPRIAYCGGEQGKFWQTDRWLFSHSRGRISLDQAATDVGLDAAKLKACVTQPSTYERADREAEFAQRHVKNTPHYMVDGKAVAIEDLPGLFDTL